MMKLLEVIPEKRITAEAALNHPFLQVKKKNTIIETPDEICNIEAEEGHILELYATLNHGLN